MQHACDSVDEIGVVFAASQVKQGGLTTETGVVEQTPASIDAFFQDGTDQFFAFLSIYLFTQVGRTTFARRIYQVVDTQVALNVGMQVGKRLKQPGIELRQLVEFVATRRQENCLFIQRLRLKHGDHIA